MQGPAELIAQLLKSERAVAGDVVEDFFRNQSVASHYWPDDDELRSELGNLLAYTRLRRGRLRMVLEAIEDHQRGWKGSAEGLGGQRVPRGRYAIEHVIPRKWGSHWPLVGAATEVERDQHVHRLGNLTLLTGRLNSKVSNGAWVNKREALKEHDVLKLNREFLDAAGERWNEDSIRRRTDALIEAIIEIWPVPDGHRSNFGSVVERPRHKIDIADLISAGLIESGATLYARRKKHVGREATVLPDGRIEVDGVAYSTPSGAAVAISGKSENGWWFFLTNPNSHESLTDLWHKYIDQTSADIDDSDISEDDDEE